MAPSLVSPFTLLPHTHFVLACQMAHQLHHSEKYGGVPFGMFLGPQVSQEGRAGEGKVSGCAAAFSAGHRQMPAHRRHAITSQHICSWLSPALSRAGAGGGGGWA